MSIFDKREGAMEAKFVLDSEKEFKAQARRNKQLGLWAAGLMGLSASEHEAYATSVIVADMEEPGDEDVFRKVRADFDAKGVEISDGDLRAKMEAILYDVRKALAEE